MIQPSPKFLTTNDIRIELKKIPHLGGNILSRNGNFYTYSLLLIGILNRAYEFTDSAVWAIDNKRPQTVMNLLRALTETLGITHYMWKNVQKKDNPDIFKKITSLLLGSRNNKTPYKSVNVLTYIDGATEMFPKLRQNYDDISEVVHPNAISFMYSGKVTGEKIVDRWRLVFLSMSLKLVIKRK